MTRSGQVRSARATAGKGRYLLIDSNFIVSFFNQQENTPTHLGGKCLPFENSPTDKRVMENGPKEKQRLETQARVRVAILKEKPE